MSEARLDINPMPPANGNISAAATTPAKTQHPANLMTDIKVGRRSDIHPDYLRPRVKSGASAEACLRGRTIMPV
jgi:hypothetical protein